MAAKEAADGILAQLISVVNRTGSGFSITLNINGQTVTGTLISNRRWFELQASSLKAVSELDDNQVGFHTLFEEWGRIATEHHEEGKQVDAALEGLALPDRFQNAIDEVDEHISFVHLEDARIVEPQGLMPANGMCWRGRIEQVAGWSLGQLQTSK